MNEKEIFEQNEIVANKSMTSVSTIMSGILFTFWLLCLCGINIFSFTQSTIKYIELSFPIDFLLLLTPLAIQKFRPDYFKKSGFKYFVIVLFLVAVGAINMVLPKDGILLWATVIVVALLYFDPKVTRFAFIAAAVLMFVVTPLSAIYGSWDCNVMWATETDFVKYFKADGVTSLNLDSRQDRIYWLSNYNEITGNAGLNRWLAMLLFYFLPRFLIFSVIYLLAIKLSNRTKEVLYQSITEAKNIQRIESDLNTASNIQNSCLPTDFPNSSRCELYAMMDPAREVGGDFYDFFKVDDDHAVLVIGDVAGKGIPASLFMMKTQSVINALANFNKTDPAVILETVNKAVTKNNDMNMFVTCWLGILDLNTGVLTYSSAGHNPPIVKKGDKYYYLKDKCGFVLGGFEGSRYVNHTIELGKGDKLFIYTDGVTEAHNLNNELFSEERLLKFFETEDPSPVDGIVKLRENINDFAGGAEQFDDITMLMVEQHSA